MAYPSEPVGAQIAGPIPIGPFGVASLAISQAQVALKLNVNDATTGSNLNVGVPMPFAGRIVGISETLNTNKTAGALSASPTINTTEVASTHPLYRLAMGNAIAQATKTADAHASGSKFNAGDQIGAKVTTDGSFAPAASADLLVWIWVMFEDVRV